MKEFKGFEKISTADGSFTFRSCHYDETFHSTGGAFTEALERFILPCRIGPLSVEMGKIHILDVGFGLGLNLAVLLYFLKKENLKPEIHITSLEKDEEVLKILSSFSPLAELAEEYQIIQSLARNQRFEEGNIKAKILLGKGEERIREMEEKYDAVFLDPFSPPKNPELWTEFFFKEIFSRMAPQAILSTYSSAVRVRLNLMEAGFFLGAGPHVAGKSSGTLARKTEAFPPFEKKYERKLFRRFEREFGHPYHPGIGTTFQEPG